MGTQKPVIIGEESTEDLGGPIAEHHGKAKEKGKSKKEKVADKIKEKKFDKVEKEPKIDEVKTDIVKDEVIEKPKKIKVGKTKIRSKKYQEKNSLIDKTKKYSIGEAIKLAKETSISKFDGNLDVNLRILGKSGKPENLRGFLKYPHSIGKKINAVILNEKMIEEIERTRKANFDIAIATPALMPKLAKIAKILGPKGKMPNPKAGTISDKPEEAKKKIESGQVEYKTDSYGIIHQNLGKLSTESKNLEENFKALVAQVTEEKISTVYLSATMGPSIRVDIK